MILEALGMLGTLAGGAVAANDSLVQGDAALAGSQRQATLLRAAAVDAVRRGKAAGAVERMAATEQIAELRAGAGAGGVVASSGTAAALQAWTRESAELAAQRHANNAAREAWGQQVEAWEVLRVGRETQAASRRQALAQVLGMGSSLAGQAANAKRNGSF